MSGLVRFIVQLLIFSGVVFGLHYVSQIVFESQEQWEGARYSLLQIYFVQIIMSLVVMLLVVAIAKVSFNNIGFLFLGSVLLRAIVSYIFIKPVLEMGKAEEFIKYHFLVVFMAYLAFDVFVTYVVLNQNENLNQNQVKKVS